MATRSKSDLNKIELKSIIKETINELFADEGFIQRVTKTLSEKSAKKFEEMEKTIQDLNRRTLYLEMEIDECKQKEKTNNICIYGIPEIDEHGNLRNAVIEILSKHSVMCISEDDIDLCYRIGTNKNNNKPRPVILKLKLPEVKRNIMKNSKSFRGTKIFLADDLTNMRRQLLNDAKNKLGNKNVWTVNGIVYTKVAGVVKRIKKKEDIIIPTSE